MASRKLEMNTLGSFIIISMVIIVNVGVILVFFAYLVETK